MDIVIKHGEYTSRIGDLVIESDKHGGYSMKYTASISGPAPGVVTRCDSDCYLPGPRFDFIETIVIGQISGMKSLEKLADKVSRAELKP